MLETCVLTDPVKYIQRCMQQQLRAVESYATPIYVIVSVIRVS